MIAGKKGKNKKEDNEAFKNAIRDAKEKEITKTIVISPDLKVQNLEELIPEIRIHQVELEAQAEELRLSHLALEDSRDKFLDLYEFAPLGYLTLNDRALIKEVNLTGATLLRVERSNLVNHGLGRFIAPEYHDTWDQYFVNIRQNIGKHTCTLNLIRADGSLFPAWLEGIMLVDGEGVITVRIAISDISERKRAEDAQIASEMRYRRLFEAAQDGILILDADTGQIVDANPFLINLLGFSHEQFLGKKIWEIGLFKDIIANKDNFEELQQKEYIRYEDLPLETADGRKIAVEFVSNVYEVNNTRVIQCNIRDNTGRKLAEEERARLASIIEYSGDAIIGKTLDGTITSWNTGAERIYGYSAEEMLGESISLLVPQEVLDDTGLILERIRKGEPVVRYETLRRKKDGGLINVNLTASQIRDAQYHLIGVSTIAHDITDRKLAEEAQIESEMRYRRLFEAAQDGILILDADTGQIVEANPFLINLLGFSREQFLGKKIWEIGLFKDIIANKDNFQELQREEYIRYEDLPLETADGRKIAVEFLSNVYEVNNTKVIQCNIRDINKRKLVEEALSQKNKELDGYFTNTLDLLFIADKDGHFRRLNREWELALGYSPAELEGKQFLDFVHPDDTEASLNAMSELSQGKIVLQFTNRYRHRSGSYRWIEWRLFPAGDLIYASARDVTEREMMTELVERSLAEKETLLKEIHHRVKNNLQIITSILNLQIRKTTDLPTIEALKDSQNRVRSMALIHEHLYRDKDLSHINLGNYLRSLGSGLFDTYEAANHDIRFDLNILDIFLDINTSIPLGLISNELITNSLKYAFVGKKSGKITVSASENPTTLTFIVADDGVGMPPHITLKKQKSLGLRLVNSLTRQLHGIMTIDRSNGTKFVFSIPKTDKPKTTDGSAK